MVRERVASSVTVAGSGEGRGAGDPAEQRLQPATARERLFSPDAVVPGQPTKRGLAEELSLTVLRGHLEVEFGCHRSVPFRIPSSRSFDLVMGKP